MSCRSEVELARTGMGPYQDGQRRSTRRHRQGTPDTGLVGDERPTGRGGFRQVLLSPEASGSGSGYEGRRTTGSVARPVSEGFRHCFERDVTEGRSMSWYIDLDEGNLEDEITLGPIRNVDCRRAHKHSRMPPPDRDRTGSSHSRKASSSSGWQTRSVSEQTPTNSDFVDIWSAGTNPSPRAWNRGRQWAHDQRKHFESDRHRFG